MENSTKFVIAFLLACILLAFVYGYFDAKASASNVSHQAEEYLKFMTDGGNTNV